MTTGAQIAIETAGRDDLGEVARLFRAYAAALPIDLGYQGFTEELSGLPGRYAPPSGVLLIARDEAGRAAGCVALRPLGPLGRCEMKRLYVDPRLRGSGLGRRLAEAIVEEATRIGYGEMVLDTLPSMTGAIATYRGLGFLPCEAYYETPIRGTLFFRLSLGAAGGGK